MYKLIDNEQGETLVISCNAFIDDDEHNENGKLVTSNDIMIF